MISRLHGTWLIPSREWQVGVSRSDPVLPGKEAQGWPKGLPDALQLSQW